MNATQTAILEALTASNSYHSVKELQSMIGKGETAVRDGLKALIADDHVGVLVEDGKKLYTNIPIVPEDDEPATVEEAIVESFATDENEVADELDRLGVEVKNVEGMRVEGPAPEATEAPAKKKYRRHDIPLTRTVRINQITKAEVQVASADEIDVENPEGKWVTLCLTHDSMDWSDLVLDAHFKSTYPEFCPGCAPLLVGKVGRRRAKKA
jgi:biotin operon repressor